MSDKIISRIDFKRSKIKTKANPLTNADKSKIPAKELNSDDLLRLKEAAIKYVNKKRSQYRPLSEDFASYCMIRKLDHKDSPIKFLWIDFLRTTFGDKRTTQGKSKSLHSKSTISTNYTDEHFEEFLTNPTQTQFDSVKELLTHIHSNKNFSRDQSIALSLYLIFNLSKVEIGQVLNLTKGRISQLLNPALNLIKNNNFEAS